MNLEREYVRVVGHRPPIDQSEDAWQWSYTGKKDEREKLAEKLHDQRSMIHRSEIMDRQERLF